MATINDLAHETRAQIIEYLAGDHRNNTRGVDITQDQICDVLSIRAVSSGWYAAAEPTFSMVISATATRMADHEVAVLSKLTGAEHTKPFIFALNFSDLEPAASALPALVARFRSLPKLRQVTLVQTRRPAGKERLWQHVNEQRASAAVLLHLAAAATEWQINGLILPPLAVDAEPLSPDTRQLPNLPDVAVLHLGLKDGERLSYHPQSAPWVALPRHGCLARYLKHFTNITTLRLDVRGILRYNPQEFSELAARYAAGAPADRPYALRRLEVVESCWWHGHGAIILLGAHRRTVRHFALAHDRDTRWMLRDWAAFFILFHFTGLVLETLYLQDTISPAEIVAFHPHLFDFAERVYVSMENVVDGERQTVEAEVWVPHSENDDDWVPNRMLFPRVGDDPFWERGEDGR